MMQLLQRKQQPTKRASAIALKALLSGRERYAPPPLGRGYVWSDIEVDQLLFDVEEFARHHHAKNDEARLYIGSIIVGRPTQRGARTVLDGHQRLITLAVMLSVIRDRLPGSDRGRIDRFLFRKSFLGRPVPRLQLHVTDNAWFARHIIMPGATLKLPADAPQGASRALLQATRLAVETLGATPPNQLRRIANVILDRIAFVLVKAEDERDEARLHNVLRPAGAPTLTRLQAAE